ncbi:hypothetical protein EDB92DRAFT_1820401 [Lactarius akahatsu]|uniref:Uncharacterized protein n=1 Tax=Lactarius akahatsu TaxID=416441 RepID=A0AAD4L764_9AGAM|nr:hypothetical protein EDB92DRAFT_1820401 [Lactarius akahatsu]
MDPPVNLSNSGISPLHPQNENENVRDCSSDSLSDRRIGLETIMTEVEEAVKDCSQCLPIYKVSNYQGPRAADCRAHQGRSQFLCKNTTVILFYNPNLASFVSKYCPKVLGSEDESANDVLEKKLQREEQRRSEALSLVEETHVQLETCKKELNEAEKERAAAIVYRTAAEAKAEALRKQLSEKEEQVRDLSSELSQREREMRLKEKANAGSARCDPSSSPKCCGIANTMSPTSQPFAQAVVPASRRRGPTVEYYKLQARLQAESVYKSKLEELFLKIQSLEKALDESNDLRMQVEDALESEINGCQSRHANIELDLCQTMARHSTHAPVHCDGCHGTQAVDTSSAPNREVDQQVNVNISDQKFTYIISMVVGFIAIVIQHPPSEKLALSDASSVFVPALSEEVSLPWNGVAALSR